MRAVGIDQIVIHMDEKIPANMGILKMTHDGYIPASVVPNQEDRTDIPLMAVGSLLTCGTEYFSAFNHNAM